VEGSCEHGKELSVSLKFVGILEYLSDWCHLKKDSDPWIELLNFTTDKWVIREAIAKTCKGDCGEHIRSANGHLTLENIPTTTSATRTTENPNIIARSVSG
jgi:hypothetical protein